MSTPPRRPPGRPSLKPNEPSVALGFRLAGSEFDAAYARARAERVTVNDWIRRLVRNATRDPRASTS
jgi:hypothetical protein